ncbi:MAG: cell division protein FtsA [Bacilli bacterium]|nr:cell division protein FtsA [Bacilli bacterium]
MKYIYTSIDIGSDSIKILVAEMLNSKLNVIAETCVQSKGIKKAVIIDTNDILTSLREAISNIEGKTGTKISKAIINLPSYYAKYMFVEGYSTITKQDKKIDGDDIIRALQASVYNKVPKEEEIITIMPIEFSVDSTNNIKDPKDLVGNKLSVKAMTVTAPKKIVYAFLNIFQTVGIEVEDINIGNIADYYEFKNKELDKSVCGIVNIGCDVTNISIFNKGIIINSEILPIGGKNIDNDISYVYKTSKEESKRLKETFVIANKRLPQVNEVVEVLNINKEIVKITQYDISQIVISRIEEMLEMIKKQTYLLTNKEIKYIIITGGTSELCGISYLVKEMFDDIAKIGKIETIGIRNNKYSTVSGMIKYYEEKMKLRGKKCSMLSMDEELELVSQKKKANIAKESILTKVFGYFFDN